MDSFMKWQVANWKDDNLFPPELEPQRAVHMLVDYLLGDDWYFVNPVNAKQDAEGERNYIVTTMKTYKKIIELEQNGKKVIPHEFGVMVACRSDRFSEFENPTPLSRGNDWRLEIIQNASLKYRKRSIAEMLFCMLRSGK